MIPYVDIKNIILTNFYDKFELTEEEIGNLLDMMENGEEQEAVDIFMDAYVGEPSKKFQNLMSRYLNDAVSGPMDNKDSNKLIRNVVLLSVGLIALFKNNFKKFVVNVKAPVLFKDAGLTNAKVKSAIIKETLSKYDQAINSSMSQTQTFIANSVRTLQREMVAENLFLKNSGLAGSDLGAAIMAFKSSLRSKYSDIYKASEEGNILVTRKFTGDSESVRHYKLDYYADMTTRTNLMNIDRLSNTIMAQANDEKVVEFYLADPRIVSKDREICQQILHKHVLGKCLLALDDETATMLGIMTVDEAASTPDYSFGIGCRHSVKRLGSDFLVQVNKLLKKVA